MDERGRLPADAAPVFHLPRRLSARHLAAALTAAGYALERAAGVRGDDLYLDSQDGGLRRAGLRLRRRRSPSVWQLLERGWLVAEEPAAAMELPEAGPLAAAVRHEIGERVLLPVARVRTGGRRLTLCSPVGAVLDLDVVRWAFTSPEGALTAGPRVAALESASSSPAEAQHLGVVLRDLVGLRRLGDEPLATAVRALGLPLPGAPVPDELRLAGADSMGEAARKILARQAYKMWANTAGTSADLDPEFLHDLRVATRRARSALRLLAPLYGEVRAQELRAELGWVAECLGAVRDLDVHLARLGGDLERVGAAADGDGGFTAALADRRRFALAALREALATPRYAALLETLRDVRPPADATAESAAWGETPAAETAPALVRRAARRVRRWREANEVGAAAAEQLHRLRILFKRLRYTCEFFAELFDDEFRAATSRLVPFQDCLGAHQDAVVELAVLSEYVADVSRRRRGGRGLLVLGALMQVQREVAAQQREALTRLWGGLPRLLKSLNSATPAAGGETPAAAAHGITAATAGPAAAVARRRGGRRTTPPR